MLIGDTTFFNIILWHLKASDGTQEELDRAADINKLFNRIATYDTLPNYLAIGDFNIYRSTDTAWKRLTRPGKTKFYDPVNQVGSWHSNSSFAKYHTQSPRVAQFGGGVNGGLDDRFDFILTNNPLTAGT